MIHGSSGEGIISSKFLLNVMATSEFFEPTLIKKKISTAAVHLTPLPLPDAVISYALLPT
jgi:hypothetical protein